MADSMNELEYEVALHDAFIKQKLPSVAIISRRQVFQIQACLYAEERGWLVREVVGDDHQSTEWIYSLTPEGKEYFENR